MRRPIAIARSAAWSAALAAAMMLSLAPAAALATNVTLRLVDQDGAGIAGSQFGVAAIDVPQDGTIALAPGLQLLRVFPGIAGLTQDGGLYREDSLGVGLVDTTVVLQWRQATLRLRMTDQDGTSQDSALFSTDWGVLSNGGSIVAPVTRDPGASPIGGTYADGYTVRLYPPIGGMPQTGGLWRNELVRLTPAGLDTTFVWKFATVAFHLMDQNGAPQDSAQFGFVGESGGVGPGGVIRAPVSRDPSVAPCAGDYGDLGYPVGVFPPIGGRKQSGGLWRNERTHVTPAGLDTTFVWKFATVAFHLADQNGAPQDSAVFGFIGQGWVASPGEVIRAPISHDPTAANYGGAYAEHGYPVGVYPPIGGRSQTGGLGRGEQVQLKASGLDTTFVWPAFSGVLMVTDSNGVEVGDAAYSLPYAYGSPSAPAQLPVTVAVGAMSSPMGAYAPGYPTSIRPQSNASFQGPFNFQLNPDGTFTPGFVTINGSQYGLRFGGTRTLREFPSGGGAPGDTLPVVRLEFEDPLGGAQTRGWTGSDRASVVFAHVSSRFVVNDANVTMGSRALWFGADSVSAPAEVADWVQPYGCGNDWSQRVVSEAFDGTAHGGAVFRFDAQLALGAGPVRDASAAAAFVAAQAETASGQWAFLATRWQPEGAAAFTASAAAGNGVVHGEAWLGADGNAALHLPVGAHVRLVVQTADSSNADGRLAAGPGAAVLDNLSLRDGAADVVGAATFEDGATGGWTLAAMNGAANAHATRDVPPPQTSVALANAVDAVDPSWVWTFLSVGGTLAAGTDAQLASPWYALPDSSKAFGIALEGRFNVRAQQRALVVRMLAKYAGATRPFLSAPLPYAFFGGNGSGDQESPWSSGTAATFPTDFGLPASLHPDSVKLVFEVQDRGDNASIAAGRPDTKLPVLDRISLYQVGVDRDHDGVPDCRDLCPNVPSNGQDAFGTGCPDPTSTMRHEETWRGADLPIHWTMAQAGLAGVTDGSDTAAVRTAFASWRAVPGANVPAVEDARSSLAHANALDGVNLVTFQDDIGFPPGVIALTPTTSFTRATSFNDRVYRPGEIVDADVILNPNVPFHTATFAGTTGSFDLQSVATHEIGHLLGLTHSGVAKATMYPVIGSGTDAASLEFDDEAALAAAYPSAGFASAFGAIRGRVTRGSNGRPVPGALVLAVPLVGGLPADTVASDFTDENGSYALRRLAAGSYAVRIQPLDGSIPGVVPGAISDRVAASAQTDFPAEWYSVPETSTDDTLPPAPVAVVAGQVVDSINVITNVDLTPPQVVRVLPAADTTSVRVDTAILVDFSEGVDAMTLSHAVVLRPATGGAAVGGRAQLLDGNKRLVFVPAQVLQEDTPYTLTLRVAITNTTGVPLADSVVTAFRTAARPTLAITGHMPPALPVNGWLTLMGVGFDATRPQAHRVLFSGCATCPPETAYAASTTPTRIIVRVPVGATTGAVRVALDANTSNGEAVTVLADTLPGVPVLIGSASGTGHASSVALSPDGKWAFVTHDQGVTTLGLDPTNASTYQVSSLHPIGPANQIVLLPGATRALVSQPSLGRCTLIDASPASGTFGVALNTFPLPGYPSQIALVPGGASAWISDDASDTISELDLDPAQPTFGLVLRQVKVGVPGNISAPVVDPSGTALFMASAGGMERMTLSDQSVAPMPVAAPIFHFVPGGEKLLCGCPAWLRNPLSAQPELDGPSCLSSGYWTDFVAMPTGRAVLVAGYSLETIDVADTGSTAGQIVQSTYVGSGWRRIGVDAYGVTVATVDVQASSYTLEVRSFGAPAGGSALWPQAATVGEMVTMQIANADPSAHVVVGSVSTPVTYRSPQVVTFTVPNVTPGRSFVSLELPNGTRSAGLPLDISPAQPAWNIAALSVAMEEPGAYCYSGTPMQAAAALHGTARIEPKFPTPQVVPAHITGVVAAPSGRSAYLLTQAIDAGCNLGGSFLPMGFVRPGGWDLANARVRPFLSVPIDVVLDPHSDIGLYMLEVRSGLRQIVSQNINGSYPVVVASGPIIEAADRLAMDPQGRALILTSASTHALTRLSLSGGFLDTLDFGAHAPGAMTPLADRHTLAVAGEDRVWLVDLDTKSVRASTPVRPGSLIREMYATRDGNRLVVLGAGARMGVYDVSPFASPYGRELYFASPVADADTVSDVVAGTTASRVLALFANGDSLLQADLSTGTPVVERHGLAKRSSMIVRFEDSPQVWIAARDTNGGRDSLFLHTLEPPALLELVSGSGQLGVIGSPLPRPVVVRVRDALGSPMSGVMVDVTTNGRGSFSATFATADGAGLYTDPFGEAALTWTMPDSALAQQALVSVPGTSIPALRITANCVTADTSAGASVIAFGPPDNTTGLDAFTSVYARFSKSVDLASATSHVSLLVGGSPVAGTSTFADSARTLVFRPAHALPYGAACQFWVQPGLLDAGGHAMFDSVGTHFTVQAQPALAITGVTPPAAPVGATVVVTGAGFSAAATQNLALVGGQPASILAVAENGLVVRVPPGATSGELWVRVGTAESNRVPFTVVLRDSTRSSVADSIVAARGMRDIAVTPDGARAYVTNPTLNTVFAVRIDSLKVFALIPVGVGPEAIALLPGAAARAYVANRGGGDVSVIDIAPGPTYHRVVGTIHVGADPVAVVVSAVGPRVFVACQGDGTLNVIDARPTSATYHQVVATVNTGSGTKGVVITPDGGRALVATAAGLVVVDIASHAVVATVNTGSGTRGVAITPDGALALALTDDGRMVLVVLAAGPQQYQVVATVNTGSGTRGVVITPDGTLAFVTRTGSNDVLAFRISGGTLSKDGSSTGVGASATVSDTLAVGQQPQGIGLDPQGGFALVANAGDGTVTLLNVAGAPALAASLGLELSSISLTPRFGSVRASVRLPLPYRAAQVALGGLRVGRAKAESASAVVADVNGDGIPDLSFDVRRDSLLSGLADGDSVVVNATGTVNGRAFAARDTLRLRRTVVQTPTAGAVLLPAAGFQVRWLKASAKPGATAALLHSLDGGATWVVDARNLPDVGSAVWSAPAAAESVLLAVVEVDSTLADTLVVGYEGTSGPFRVAAVTQTGPVIYRFELQPVSPNPARLTARFAFTLPRTGPVSLEIFDVQGRRVRTLLDGVLAAGPHAVSWAGGIGAGGNAEVWSGTYFARLRAGHEQAVRRFVLLR